MTGLDVEAVLAAAIEAGIDMTDEAHNFIVDLAESGWPISARPLSQQPEADNGD